MYIKGKLLTAEFKGWVHPPRDDNPKITDIGKDNLRAHFQIASWSSMKGKVLIGDVYHSVEDLLDQEECLTCDKDQQQFSDELLQVIYALKSYKGDKDITPFEHSKHEDNHGFHMR